VRPYSVFYTDEWKSYASLEQYGKHNKINHKKNLLMKRIILMVLKDFGASLKKDSINIMELIKIIHSI